MGFLPKKCLFPPIRCHLVSGFTPSMARFVPIDIISDEVCRVFVLRCQSTSHLSCPVLFRQGHLLYTVIKSYKLYIHTFIRSCIHIIYTTSFIHDCIFHPKSCLTVSLQFGPNELKWQVLQTNNLQIHFIFSKVSSPVCRITRCHSSCAKRTTCK